MVNVDKIGTRIISKKNFKKPKVKIRKLNAEKLLKKLAAGKNVKLVKNVEQEEFKATNRSILFADEMERERNDVL